MADPPKDATELAPHLSMRPDDEHLLPDEQVIRATLGALAGIGFHMFQEMLTNVGIVAGSPPALTALFPALLAAAGVAALFRWRST